MANFNVSVTESIKYIPFNLSASEGLTVNIDNPNSGASYVVLQTRTNPDGTYTIGSPKNAEGSYTLSNVTKEVHDDYKAGFVVPPGGGTVTFGNTNYVSGSEFRIQGTQYHPFYDTLLDRWPNAAAAYSLRLLNSYYDGPAIRVRRSSDDEERNIFFSGGQLDTTSLINWTKEEVITYQSNFGVDTSGVANDQTIITANQDNISDGTVSKDDCLKVTVNTALNETHQLVVGGNGGRPVGNRFRMSFEYYIPSDNLEVNGIYVALYTGDEYLEITGSWQSFSSEFDSTNTSARLYHLIGNRDSRFDGNGTDHYYIRNIQYTQLTSDGYVETWYDQSGNGNHATQTTAENQPQIVSSGSVILDNAKPIVTFDGTSQFLGTSSSILSTDFGVFGVGNKNNSSTAVLFTQYSLVDAQRTLFYMENDSTRLIGIQIGTGSTKTGTPSNTQKLFYYNRSGSDIEYADDGSIVNTFTNSTTCQNAPLRMGAFTTPQITYTKQNIQELVIYTTSQSSNRSGIESNINSHYNIY